MKKIFLYISLTSIFQNQEILLETLISLLNQKLLPDKIFIYLSIEPFLKDIGFTDKEITNESLKELLSKNENKIIINWTENIGPYRKLLPLLKEKWDEDCIIITVDDDTVYSENLIENFYNEYCKYKCIISNRGFTPKLINNDLETFDYYEHDKNKSKFIYNFPTGKGGILYKPDFFHKYSFNNGNMLYLFGIHNKIGSIQVKFYTNEQKLYIDHVIKAHDKSYNQYI